MVEGNSKTGGWMSDVQRTIALAIIATLATATLLATLKVVFWESPSDAVIDMAKVLQAALVNMGLIALGFFFGNTIAKQQADSGQQRVVERLTGGGQAPVIAWWTKLTDAEKNAITAAAQGLGGGTPDARMAAFVTASQVGTATADDLAYLVSKGLLTQARADEIRA